MFSGLDYLSDAAYDAQAAETLMSIQRDNESRPPGAPKIVRQPATRFGKAKKARKTKPKKVSLKQLQAIARANGVSIFTRRKDGKGFTKKPLTVKALKSRLSRRRVPYQSGPRPGPRRGTALSTPFSPGFAPPTYEEAIAMGFGAGYDFVCPPGMKRNKKWRPKSRKHRRKCLKDKGPRVTLSELQNHARANGVSIFTLRKDGKGFTKKPLTVKALKTRLSRKKIPYRSGRRLGPLANTGFYADTPFSPGFAPPTYEEAIAMGFGA